MRVVITGGTGLIGRALAAELLHHGDEVAVTSRRPQEVRGLPARVKVERWDGASAEQLAPLVEGAGALVHLAGENIGAGRWTAERKRRIRDSRLRSSRAVAEAIGAASRPPAVLVQASGVDVYGDGGDELLTESSPPGSGFLADLCRDWEAASAPVEAVGVRRVLTRSAVVLASDDGALPRMLLPFRLFAGGPLGSGRQWLPWIHVADEAGAMRFLIARPDAAGPYNLASPGPVTNREFAKAAGRVLHRPAVLPAPAFALKLALGEMSAMALESKRVVPDRLLAAGYVFRFPDIEAALRDLVGSRSK